MKGPVIFGILFLMLLTGTVSAAVAEILSPIVVNVSNNQVLNVGIIGPGQTLDIVVNGKVEKARWGIEGRWRILKVVEVPPGWEGFDSKELGLRMKAGVKAAKDTPDGEYKIKFALEEDPLGQQQLGTVSFYVSVRVTKNVMSFSVPNKDISTGVGQPARYDVIIKNIGTANDVFEISSKGVPTWDHKKSLHVPGGRSVATFYEFVSNEETEYEPTIIVKSTSSNTIISEQNVKMTAKSDVIGDIKATKNGVLLFPVILEPLYSLLGIIGCFA